MQDDDFTDEGGEAPVEPEPEPTQEEAAPEDGQSQMEELAAQEAEAGACEWPPTCPLPLPTVAHG